MTLHDLVERQANDAGLWFSATTAPEAYLQHELRRLHAVIDAQPPPTAFASWYDAAVDERLRRITFQNDLAKAELAARKSAATIAEQQREIERLKSAIERHGAHIGKCMADVGDDCTCGLDEVMR